MGVFDLVYGYDEKQEHQDAIKNKNNISRKKSVSDLEKDVIKKTADNIKKSEKLRIEINKDIARGTDHTKILCKALECIALMTGDAIFKQNIKKL